MADKDAKTEMLALRVPSELKEKLAALAEKDRRSMSVFTQMLIEEALEARAKTARKGGR